jgi:hypothetical protein
VLEVVTRLGDTVVDVMVVPRARLADAIVRAGFEVPEDLALPLLIEAPLATLVATPVARPQRDLPRARLSRATLACLAFSLAAHVGLYIAAERHAAREQQAGREGASRPRLVANHATAARGEKSKDVVPSVTAEQSAPREARASDPAPRGHGPPQPTTASGREATNAQVAAHTPDPCPGGDCGIIPSGPIDTSAAARSGAAYALHPRERRELALSVVNCSVDGGCNTVSGTDQDDIRAAIAGHVGDLHNCLRHGAATVQLNIDDAGDVHVVAKDGGEPADCIASLVAKLSLRSSGRGDVTLAFTAGD